MINREKVIRHITAEICIAKVCKKDFASVDIDMLSDALDMLKEQQKLIDDTPHWIFGNSYGHAWMKCSNCCVSQSGQTGCWSYCPNCGAKMEGQVEWE